MRAFLKPREIMQLGRITRFLDNHFKQDKPLPGCALLMSTQSTKVLAQMNHGIGGTRWQTAMYAWHKTSALPTSPLFSAEYSQWMRVMHIYACANNEWAEHDNWCLFLLRCEQIT